MGYFRLKGNKTLFSVKQVRRLLQEIQKILGEIREKLYEDSFPRNPTKPLTDFERGFIFGRMRQIRYTNAMINEYLCGTEYILSNLEGREFNHLECEVREITETTKYNIDQFWDSRTDRYDKDALLKYIYKLYPALEYTFKSVLMHIGDDEFDEVDDGYDPEDDIYITDGIVRLAQAGYNRKPLPNGGHIDIPLDYSTIDIRGARYIIFLQKHDNSLYLLFDAKYLDKKYDEIMSAAKKIREHYDELY